MTHLSQDLHNAFPDDEALLRRLKTEDRHFMTLAERFDSLDAEALRIESGAEAASDFRLEEIKKHRLAMLDEIAAHVATARGAS